MIKNNLYMKFVHTKESKDLGSEIPTRKLFLIALRHTFKVDASLCKSRLQSM